MRFLSFAKNIILSNLKKTAKYPYKLTLRVTNRCNQKCKICNIWQNASKKDFDLEEYDRFFSQADYFNWIDVTGGEIFLREDIERIFGLISDYCKKLYFLHFPTNGFLTSRIVDITKAIAQKSRAKIVVTVSIDGYPRLNDVLRGSAGATMRAVDTYKELLKIKNVETFVGLTLSEYNINELDAIENWFLRELNMSLEDVHINFMNHSDHFFYNLNEPKLKNEDILPVLNRVYELRCKKKFSLMNQIEKTYLRLAKDFFSDKISPLDCRSLNASCFVDSSGDVYPCTIFPQKLSNLRDYEYNLGKIWQSNAADELRAKISSKECPNCWTPCEAYPSLLGSLKSFFNLSN